MISQWWIHDSMSLSKPTELYGTKNNPFCLQILNQKGLGDPGKMHVVTREPNSITNIINNLNERRRKKC